MQYDNDTVTDFPSFDDAMSGTEVFPDIPMLSFDPLIIQPVHNTQQALPSTFNIHIGNVLVGDSGYTQLQKKLEYEEWRAPKRLVQQCGRPYLVP